MPKKKKAKKAKKTKLLKKLKTTSKVADKKSSILGQDEKPEIKKIKKQPTEKRVYNLKDFVVYPKHGVGKITAIEKAKIGEIDIQFYKILVEKEKLTLELNYTRGFLASVEKKLSNERFVANAPEKVIALERKKAADAKEKIVLLEKNLALL